MSSSTEDTSPILATRVPDALRLKVLPERFGRHMLTVEGAVYDWMARLSPGYRGGFWHFYQLSNGGFYMVPNLERLRVVSPNGFDGTLSAEAAGITACLFTFSHLSFEINSDVFAEHYHQLLPFAIEHAEAALILGATD